MQLIIPYGYYETERHVFIEYVPNLCKKQAVLLKKKDGIQLTPPASILLNNQAD